MRLQHRREWRALDLVAPSLKLDPNAKRFPLWVIPEKKLSVQDILEICGDYYKWDSLRPLSHPRGRPLRRRSEPYHKERSITCSGPAT
jgi:dipeptidase